MKHFLKYITALATVLSGTPAYADAVIFSGSDVKTLKANIDLFGQSKIMSGTVDPTSVATSAPKGTLYLNSSSAIVYRKTDSGSSTNWVSMASNDLLTASVDFYNATITTSVAANALTIALKTLATTDPAAGDPVKISFRSATLTSGVYVQRTVTAATSVVVSSGSTLGHASGRTSYTYVYALDNAGTVELAVSSRYFRPGDRCSTTAEGGAGAADSGTVMYSTTARTNVGCRLIAMLTDSQTTAGTWASNVTQIDIHPNVKPIAPSVRYTSDAANVVSRNAWTTMSYEDLDVDAYNAYASGTFTAPWSGNYVYHHSNEIGGLTGNTMSVYRVNKNGTVVQHGPQCKAAGSPYNATSALCATAGTIHLAAGDTVTWQLWFDDSTANRNLTTTTGAHSVSIYWTGF